MFKRRLMTFALAVVLTTIALPAVAAGEYCDYWVCERAQDTANCKGYLGWGKNRDRGTDCDVKANCIWTYSQTLGWTVSCQYYCDVTRCYEV